MHSMLNEVYKPHNCIHETEGLIMKSKPILKKFVTPLSALMLTLLASQTQATIIDVTVTVTNLAPTNSVSFSPLHLGFHNGTFDAFDLGSPASEAIISIAEGGSGSDWFPAFAAAEPNAVLGTVANGGPSVPSGNAGIGNIFTSTASSTFRVDTSQNAFFTFANMVVPSNDLFLSNDSPIRLFDSIGNLLVSQILQTGASIWDANSEVADPSAAAFIQGGINGNRTEEGGLVAFDFSELSVFDSLTTAAGYTFDYSQLANNTPLYSISFDTSTVSVPEPATFTLFALGVLGLAIRHKRKQNNSKLV
jgi:hypothetical protein